MLSGIIGESQTSFLANRRASDHAIVVQEVISHFQKMKGKSGNMALKINLKKAFDRIEWSFIRDTLDFLIRLLGISFGALPKRESKYTS